MRRKNNLNLHEVSSLVEYARQWECVVGIQFQPIKDAGRVENFDYASHSCDLSSVRRELIVSGSVPFLDPHPAGRSASHQPTSTGQLKNGLIFILLGRQNTL